jgi:hypothetical protein
LLSSGSPEHKPHKKHGIKKRCRTTGKIKKIFSTFLKYTYYVNKNKGVIAYPLQAVFQIRRNCKKILKYMGSLPIILLAS